MTQDASSTRTLSIIVPTYNRRERLRRLLLALETAHSGGTAFEVIVPVDGSVDGTQQMLAELRTSYMLRVVEQDNAGPAAARNRALAIATGDVVVFLDDDVVPTPGLLERHLAVHDRDDRVVAIGPMLAPPGTDLSPWLAWEAATLRKQYNAMLQQRYAPTPRQFYTANASVRREHLVAVGGFDETFKRFEDVELAYRLAERGVRFRFVPEAVVLHEPDRSFESWLRLPYEYGRLAVLLEHLRRRGTLTASLRERRQRHALSRLLADWCVGHRWRVTITVRLFSAFVRQEGRVGFPRALRLAMCSAIFHVQYWQGVADATGLGPGLWRALANYPPPQALPSANP